MFASSATSFFDGNKFILSFNREAAQWMNVGGERYHGVMVMFCALTNPLKSL